MLKKIALILLFAIVLTSFARAPAFLPTKDIGDSSFKLISNTDQCLTSCEAWIEWDLTNEKANVDIPQLANSQFKFEVNKREQKFSGLKDFGVSVYQMQLFEVPTYCIVKQNYDIEKEDIGNFISCEAKGCSEKNENECSCIRDAKKVCGSHFEKRMVYLQEFYGFRALKGQKYLLKVWGNKKASIEKNSVDWVPTFFGQKIGEWAWWNTDWTYKHAINSMVVATDLNANSTIKIESIDFSALNIECADLNDLRIINEDTDTELERIVEGGLAETDGNIFFNIVNNLDAGTYNGKFYIYLGEATCAAPPFEDFNFSTNHFSNIDNYTIRDSAGGNITIQDGNAINGYALQFLTDGADDSAKIIMDANYSLSEWGSIGLDVWFKFSGAITDMKRSYFYIASATDNTKIITRVRWELGDFENDTFNPAVVLATNGWYKLRVTQYDSTHFNWYIFDDTNTLQDYGENILNFGGQAWTNNINIKYEIFDDQTFPFSWYYDEMSFIRVGDSNPNYVLGMQQGQIPNIDINMLAPTDGYILFEGQQVDVNFYIQTFNDANSALVDLNYTNAINNNVIINDINTQTLNCSGDNNLSALTLCHYNWTVPKIFGEWTISSLAYNAGETDANIGGNFTVNTIDLNANFDYSFQQAQSGAKVIYNFDGNDTSDFNYVTPTSYEWLVNNEVKSTNQNAILEISYAGTWEISYRVLGTDVFGNDFNSDRNISLTVSPGFLQIHFRDENNSAVLNPTIDVNGVSASTTGGLLHIDLNNMNTQDINVFTYSTTHAGRTFYWQDLNQFATIDINASLLPTVLGKYINFQFFDTDATTLLSNYVLEAWVGGSTESNDQNYAGRIILDSQARGTLFLDNNALDANYMFVPISPTGVKKYYPTLQFNVLIPKNEVTLVNITPFDVALSGVSSQQWIGQTADVNFRAFPNTSDLYVIDINASNYFPRTYIQTIPGNPTSYSLQPYLAAVDDGAFQSVLFTLTQSNLGIPGITIIVQKDIPGSGLTIVEQKITDVAGSATFSFISGDTYILDFIKDGVIIWDDVELRPVFTAYQFYPQSQTITIPDFNVSTLWVTFYPEAHVIDSNFMVDLNVDVNISNGDLLSLNILIYLDTNTLFDGNFTELGFYDFNVGIAGAPANLPLTIEIIVTTTKGEILTQSKSYTINLSYQQSQLSQMLAALPGELNRGRNAHHLEFTTILFAFLTIFVVGAIGAKGRLDFSGTAIIAMFIMGVGVLLGFVMFEIFIAASVITAALIMLARGAF